MVFFLPFRFQSLSESSVVVGWRKWAFTHAVHKWKKRGQYRFRYEVERDRGRHARAEAAPRAAREAQSSAWIADLNLDPFRSYYMLPSVLVGAARATPCEVEGY